jgi:hypothetical protein
MNGAIVGMVLLKMSDVVSETDCNICASNEQVVLLVEEPVTAM